MAEHKTTPAYDLSIHHNPDAQAWARFYCETFPDADEGLMQGWFANAMMAMHDWQMQQWQEAGIPDPAAFVQAARGMREALESLLKECWEDQHSHMTRDFFERHYKDELAALTAFDAAMGEGQSDE